MRRDAEVSEWIEQSERPALTPPEVLELTALAEIMPPSRRTPLPAECNASCFVTLGEGDEAVSVEVAYNAERGTPSGPTDPGEGDVIEAWYARVNGKWVGVYSGIFSADTTAAMESACFNDARGVEVDEMESERA